ncbi:rRNA-processing protein FYV7 [Lycium ferocissimum]|uniref:rRNA-processing protein FYV7 n=1 Tax=Lycium ferocissimum TaxID=112874 RepID=UPI002815E977|nr:rRNA-processing protein FYV7 [Lycium ferocissimum]
MKKFAEAKDETKKKAKSFKDKKKNMQRLGGGRGGLSLEAFANAKTKSNTYNPAIIKKQREFYKNAKYVNKYKRIVKQQGEQLEPSESARQQEDEKEIEKADKVDNNSKKNQKNNARSLKELYERKQEEEGKARTEREAIISAKNEERQKAESRRKALREKMFKKTRSGQPVMKYRIEHILETLQGSKS